MLILGLKGLKTLYRESVCASFGFFEVNVRKSYPNCGCDNNERFDLYDLSIPLLLCEE